MVKLKYLCKSFTTPIIQSELEMKPQEGLFPVYGASGLAGYSKTCATDEKYLGIVKDGAGVGRIRIYPEYSSLLGTLAYIVPNEKTDIRWLKYAIDAMSLGERIDSTTIPHIYFSEYGNRYVCDLDIDEQIRIADYLDQQCAHIDAVIEKTKASIEEYKKLKQAVITQAVTKGIRGDRPMKASGIEWISELPKDWEIKRFKFVADSLVKGNGITKDDVRENGDIPCVRYGEIYTKYDNSFNECVSATNEELIGTKQYFSYGDLLFTCTGELVEEIGKSITYIGNEQCLAGGDIIIARHHQNPVFLNYALNSAYTQAQKSCNKNKLKVVHISAPDIANIVIALPTMEEQEEIAQYLDEKCGEIKKIIDAKQQQLQVILDYKKSLIYEYVTGKKEVPQSCQ